MIYDSGLYDQMVKDSYDTSQSILKKYKEKCTKLNVSTKIYERIETNYIYKRIKLFLARFNGYRSRI